MCGIAGYISRKRPSESVINSTLALMKNRGPDFQSYSVLSLDSYYVTLLHSRLSIIDLDPRSNQPFTIGTYTLIFNGEIYNYRELRSDLKEKGIQLETMSDTEVVLQYYIHHGVDCVSFFEGMWSFAIFDLEKQQLFLSRDRFGEKPLYFAQTDGAFVFGSEVKFLRALSEEKFALNYDQVTRYLVNGFRSLHKQNDTFYHQIQQVSAATNLTVDANLKLHFTRYWRPDSKINESLSFAETIEGFKYHFLKSIELRLRADVPIAFCLSGGVDSASIASVASKVFNAEISTFSIIDSDDRYNETVNIDATVNDLGCPNTKVNVSRKDFFSRLKKLIMYHDSPISTISYYVHSFLSEAISSQGLRVAVSGTGADELVTGYYDHFLLHLYEMRNLPEYKDVLSDWTAHVKPLIRNPFLQDPLLYSRDPKFRSHIYLNREDFLNYLTKDFQEDFMESHYCDSMLRNRMMNELFNEIVPVILHEDDLNSMMFSVENRSPFLDTSLFSFCYSIPPRYLIKGGYGKFVLREAMKGVLNEKVRTDRTKKGFNTSLNSLVDFNCSQTRKFLLADSPIFEIIDREKIESLFDINPLPNSYSKFLFNFINIKVFLESFS